MRKQTRQHLTPYRMRETRYKARLIALACLMLCVLWAMLSVAMLATPFAVLVQSAGSKYHGKA